MKTKILRKNDLKKILGLRGDSSLDRLEKAGVRTGQAVHC
jgi:hypothetical protein